MNVVCVGRKMNENNVIELWIVGIEYVVIMVVNEYLVYKVSLGYVVLALVYCCPTGMWLYGRC
jgi:nucleoside permease NupC